MYKFVLLLFLLSAFYYQRGILYGLDCITQIVQKNVKKTIEKS